MRTNRCSDTLTGAVSHCEAGLPCTCQRTHERTHQTMLLAGKVIALLALVLAAVGCGNPAGPTEVQVPIRNVALARELIACHAKFHGFVDYRGNAREVGLRLVEHVRSDGAKAWGSMQSQSITVVRSFLESWAPVDVEMVMGHELAHVMGIWDEDEATRWASRAYYNAGCRE